MAPRAKSVIRAPRAAEEIAESIKNCRDLIGVANAQIDKARADLGVARAGLAKLEEELNQHGVSARSNGGGAQ